MKKQRRHRLSAILNSDGLIIRNNSPFMWRFKGGYASLSSAGAARSWNYYITDHLGSTRMVVTSTNTIKDIINYYPYGSEMTMTSPTQLTTNPDWQAFRFSGKELDKINGLNMYDFGARLYDVAGVPMWTSIDPLAEQNYSVTPYSYCNGDPVNRIDPDGKKVRFGRNVSSDFKKAFATAILIMKNANCDGVFAKLEEKDAVIYIKPASLSAGSNRDCFDPNTNTIYWSPNLGLMTDGGDMLSPTTLLNHEAGHALNYNTDKYKYEQDAKNTQDGGTWGNVAEKDVITGVETSTAKALGEIPEEQEYSRYNHNGTYQGYQMSF